MSKLKSVALRLIDWVARRFGRASSTAAAETQMLMLLQGLRNDMPDNPVLQGSRVYNQCDEDGILFEIVRRVASQGPFARTLVEIGASNGLENMTHGLMLTGFRGYWVEGSSTLVGQINEALGGVTFPALKVQQLFVDRENIKTIFSDAQKHFGTQDIDVFSMDVDGNDIHLIQSALTVTKPKIIVAEYNGKFPPPMKMTVHYNATHNWGRDDFYGVSLQMLVDSLPDYQLVSCNLSGVNAFFVRKDFAGLFTVYPLQKLYQPSRLHLVGLANGHAPSLKFLRQYVRGEGL